MNEMEVREVIQQSEILRQELDQCRRLLRQQVEEVKPLRDRCDRQRAIMQQLAQNAWVEPGQPRCGVLVSDLLELHKVLEQ